MRKLINEILMDIRKKHKLSRNGLNELSGFKARTIESYESGQNPASKEYIEFISLFFGYSIEYIKGINHSVLDRVTVIINIYQSIYNYDNKKIADILEISENEYEKNFYYLSKERHTKLTDSNAFLLIEKLNIKPSCVMLSLNQIIKSAFVSNKEINNLEHRYNKLLSDGLEITPEYYAQIIKRRNQPKKITPNIEKEMIPQKHKEILELLPYASDSFLEKLKKKLISLKEVQQVEDL